MRLLRLTLEQFRNYGSQTLQVGEGNRQALIGENGSGKTNLLEAMGMLSLTKSCRGRDEEDLVQWGKDFYRVRGVVRSDDGEERMLEVVSVLRPRRRKALFVNDVITPASAFVGLLPTVFFLPQDLTLFSGPPAERRRFLDQLLCQVSPEYLQTFATYQKILQQRNALLKRIADGREHAADLDLWDRELSVYGSRITLARLELIETLNLTLTDEVQELGERWSDARIVYDRKTSERQGEVMEAELRDLLLGLRDRDILLQVTSVGPHREDWQMLADGRLLPTFASRGQERAAVLAMLFLEVSYLELRRGERPMIVLDDAFSELDDPHQRALLSALTDYQVFLTSTRLPLGAGQVDVWEVAHGKVLPSETLASI